MKVSELSSRQNVQSKKRAALKLRLLAPANSNIPAPRTTPGTLRACDDQASALSTADQIEPSALLSVALFSLSLAILVAATSTMFDSTWSQALRGAFVNLLARLVM
ncbi:MULTISPECIES: hypothetical protein [unclassified Rhizobium]|uniref:hypothetical protein n=1 Tax=unclassified Rhizobium TaxID=2613769 RepID=UPI00104AEF02|nr:MULTISPECIES: hypothetical protein [unclassified Rhizobium]MBB3397422.1 hypothetical protein [Rhizobium sp. BK060]MBB4170630.1 hypothetical protein [Rhizobium sp. BK538]TCM76991.1 hypothetical protein EV291_1087 [Rhizobium sp. BK068]